MPGVRFRRAFRGRARKRGAGGSLRLPRRTLPPCRLAAERNSRVVDGACGPAIQAEEKNPANRAIGRCDSLELLYECGCGSGRAAAVYLTALTKVRAPVSCPRHRGAALSAGEEPQPSLGPTAFGRTPRNRLVRRAARPFKCKRADEGILPGPRRGAQREISRCPQFREFSWGQAVDKPPFRPRRSTVGKAGAAGVD